MTRLDHPGKLARQARYWRDHGRGDVAERLEGELVAAGRCRICGRTLTDPGSVAAGVGPECAARIIKDRGDIPPDSYYDQLPEANAHQDQDSYRYDPDDAANTTGERR
jgi:hypothetical protein